MYFEPLTSSELTPFDPVRPILEASIFLPWQRPCSVSTHTLKSVDLGLLSTNHRVSDDKKWNVLMFALDGTDMLDDILAVIIEICYVHPFAFTESMSH